MSENKRGRKKTKDRVSTAIMIDRDLYEWTVGKNRSDIVNVALRSFRDALTAHFEAEMFINGDGEEPKLKGVLTDKK